VLLSIERLTLLNDLALTYHKKISEETVSYLKGRGFSQELASEHLLGSVPVDCDPAHVQFIGWLSIPYRVVNGVAGFKFRRVDDLPGPRYMAPMHQPARLFNAVDLQKSSDTIAICEGELDAVIASQLLPSVGVPGVKAWRPHFNRLFGGYRRVLVLADNDDKKDGTNPGMELAEKVLQEVEHAELIPLPLGSDVNSIVLDEGLEGLRRRLGIDERL